MLSLPSRALVLRPPSTLFSIPTALQTPSHVIARTIRNFARDTEPTGPDADFEDSAEAANNSSMDQITDILDDVDSSESPRSYNFSGKPLVTTASQLSPTQCSWHP
jgi:hypothetical protein